LIESLFIMLVIFGLFLWILTFMTIEDECVTWASVIIVGIFTMILWIVILANSHYLVVPGDTSYQENLYFGLVCHFFIWTTPGMILYRLYYFRSESSEQALIDKRDELQKQAILRRRFRD